MDCNFSCLRILYFIVRISDTRFSPIFSRPLYMFPSRPHHTSLPVSPEAFLYSRCSSVQSLQSALGSFPTGTMAIRAKMGEDSTAAEIKIYRNRWKAICGINKGTLLTYQQCVFIDSQKPCARARKGCHNCVRECPPPMDNPQLTHPPF